MPREPRLSVRDHRLGEVAFPAVVAHRGASSTHPENTLGAFEEAVRLGARLVEFDVRLSRDAMPVVMHDPTVDRTTDGRGRVDELDASELAVLNAGDAESPQPVPALGDVLDRLSERAGVVLEVKNLPWEPGYRSDARPIVETILWALERSGFVGPVLLVSFDPQTLDVCRSLAPDVPAGLLSAPPVDPREALAFAVDHGLEMVLPGTRSLIPAGGSFVEEVQRQGLRLGTWTVDDPVVLKDVLDLGVDAVASNDPARALAALESWVAR